MRAPSYDRFAKKQTVSLTVNSDLYAKVRRAGINASQIAEEALAGALDRALAATMKAEVRQDLDAYNAYVAEHGSPADLVRQHYEADDDAV
ncbi:type II toxin-antitoxin system CcdA family antitoxin [Azospirillum sp.]|uniref:type II toxin-antitoxin system CcdA family antitoxin n=1 Tax=Azospirillum sp. TaxID=34012 RepID=UPI002D317653|nr:type II toxin-antitoxin system CcdA family antitoxin [Azospirillum sp.]HYD68233.1 type II toxin-antitoxin system CcdA family antitoxin [Azospirillum sp.]